jgi:hypothetical protein
MTNLQTLSAPLTDPLSAPLTDDDWAILNNVDSAITEGQDLKKWWAETQSTRVPLNNFPVARQIHRPDLNYAFLLNANLRTGMLPVAGVIQDQLFNFRKAPPGMRPSPEWMRDQLREFILHYFMRLTSAQPPVQPGERPGDPPADSAPRPGHPAPPRYGWGYKQRYDLVSLDEVGPKYKWVVFKVNIYHFDFPIDIAGYANGPKLVISMQQPVHAVMTPDYLVDRENPEPGVLGEYGYGYSVVPDPTYKTLFAAGPSQITNTIETLHFRVLDTGEVRAHMDFITPQPARIVNFDPVKWSFQIADRLTFGAASLVLAPFKQVLEGITPQVDPVYMAVRLANVLTLGIAGDEFGVTNEQLFKTLMTLHFTDVYNMFNLAASHFGLVSDWTDTENLPEWTKGTYGPDPN